MRHVVVKLVLRKLHPLYRIELQFDRIRGVIAIREKANSRPGNTNYQNQDQYRPIFYGIVEFRGKCSYII